MGGTDGWMDLDFVVVVAAAVVVGPLSVSLCTVRRALLIPLLLACVLVWGGGLMILFIDLSILLLGLWIWVA